MKHEKIIKKGKDLLADHGVVESRLNHKGMLLEPSVPGLGTVGTGTTFLRNKKSLSRYFIKTQLLGDNFVPNTNIELFGIKLAIPILVAPMSGIKTNLNGVMEEYDFLKFVLSGCKDTGTIGVCGDSFDTTSDYIVPDLIKNIGGIGVCKPRNFYLLKDRIEELKKVNVIAIGIDLDGIAGMLLDNGLVTRKSKGELRQIRALFDGPMFLKGITSLEDALLAHETGYDAIVISNHGGRSIDYSLGTADVLPQIAKVLKGKIKILVDGGVKSGYDAFIYLALGADAVLVGRTALYSVIGGGREGLKVTLLKLASDLKRAMIFSSTKNITDINSGVIDKYE
jgi:isopentenyl diphosphate isomerase/L-lactate dehydrogenase-like FMN-dependent dehydrogenase